MTTNTATLAALIMAGALLAGCAPPKQAAPIVRTLPAASAVQQPTAPAAAILPPSASQPDLAIAAVKGFHPPGSKDSVQDFITTATVLSTLSSFKEVGWGAEPASGGAWKVTDVYVGSAAVERRAEWRVTLTPRVVSALNAPARDLEAHARRLAGLSGKQQQQ